MHDVVSSSSARFVIFLLPSPPSLPCSLPPARTLPSIRPPVRPKCSPSSGGITRVSHYPNVRPFEARPTDQLAVAASAAACVRPLSCCVASFSSSFRLPSFPIVPRCVSAHPPAPAVVKRVRRARVGIPLQITRNSDARTKPISKGKRGRLGIAPRSPFLPLSLPSSQLAYADSLFSS